MHGGAEGDRRIGVIWHTERSGKSLSMLFYAGCIIEEPAIRISSKRLISGAAIAPAVFVG